MIKEQWLASRGLALLEEALIQAVEDDWQTTVTISGQLFDDSDSSDPRHHIVRYGLQRLCDNGVVEKDGHSWKTA